MRSVEVEVGFLPSMGQRAFTGAGRIFSLWMKWRREKARPHPNLLPREKESGRAARCMIGGELAHDSL